VDGRPNRRNKNAFSYSSGITWTLPQASFALKSTGNLETFVEHIFSVLFHTYQECMTSESASILSYC